MKKLLLLSAAITLAVGCSSPKNYTITGTVADTTLNGQMVYLSDYSSNSPIDSCVVADAKFTFSGPADSAFVLRVDLGRLYANLVSEVGNINVALAKPAVVSGTPLNDILQSFTAAKDSINNSLYSQYQALRSAVPQDMAAMDSISNLFSTTTNKLINDLFEGNKANNLGVFLAWNKLSNDKLSSVQMDSLFKLLSPNAIKFAPLQKKYNNQLNKENTVEGKMFADFNGVNATGDSIKLSDFVGKGKYVLADFWASWCGPCRGEVPNLKEIYEKYTDKGLVVLGVNVWDKKDAFNQAVVELEMPWAQICSFDNTTPTDQYGIDGIPHIILFAPDGTIAARGLRGDAMKAKMAELFAK